MSQLALIIDDEPDIRELLQITLQRMKIDCHCAENLAMARTLLNQYKFDLCLTDMKLPDGDGVEFVNEVQTDYPHIPIAVITAHGSMDSAIQALKYGAFDFLTKPIDLNSLRTIVQNAISSDPDSNASIATIIGESDSFKELRKTIKKVARSQAPIYISGESGTGKELVAKMIHDSGPRADKPFVPVNCGAIPHELMESEFFGHKKGSFTGADSDKEGLFLAADGGTLFLDEVADLPLHLQVKLLRAIQEKRIRPVGAQEEIEIDIRILCATHKDLSVMVNQESFRQDLYYRINVIQIHVPALREHLEDIALLVEHILQQVSDKSGEERKHLSEEALNKLQSYSFPGNVRELENILERALTLAESELIMPEDLLLNNKEAEHKNEFKENNSSASLTHQLDEIERNAILDVLEQTKWNRTAAAKILGLSLRVLRYRLEKYGLDK
ncbi:MAG: sigma-54-dependent Fis family transcriptional regulator [Proteobacteria bacterium]|nr:sigma-54-dependent Fis family transcriptional regulator [Pseudomonadota bacterium]NOG60118.1 sigma-54-dependent Fis family transcriptional regulator [Pseudomonadota bacterium]